MLMDILVVMKHAKIVVEGIEEETRRLATETVEGTALSLECVDNVERSDCLSLGVLSVCNCVADDTSRERS